MNGTFVSSSILLFRTEEIFEIRKKNSNSKKGFFFLKFEFITGHGSPLNDAATTTEFIWMQ